MSDSGPSNVQWKNKPKIDSKRQGHAEMNPESVRYAYFKICYVFEILDVLRDNFRFVHKRSGGDDSVRHFKAMIPADVSSHKGNLVRDRYLVPSM